MLKGLKGIDECSKGKYSLNGEGNVSKSTHNLKKSHGVSKTEARPEQNVLKNIE